MTTYHVTIYHKVWTMHVIEADSPLQALEKGMLEDNKTSFGELTDSDYDGYNVYDPETEQNYWNDENSIEGDEIAWNLYCSPPSWPEQCSSTAS